MTAIRPGKYLTFLPLGNKTVKDSISIAKKSELLWNYSLVRKRVDSSIFRNFIKYEQGTFNLELIDDNSPYLGGKVQAEIKQYNFSNLTTNSYKMFGYFTINKLVLSQFRPDRNPNINDDHYLMQTTQVNLENTDILHRQTIELNGNGLLYYKSESNSNLEHFLNEDIPNSNTELVSKGQLNLKELLYHSLP